MAFPLYEKAGFGLDLANQLEVGYNLGTVPWLCLLATTSRRSYSSPKLIWTLLGLQAIAVSLLCAAVPGSVVFGAPALVAAMVLGGTCGYGAQFVCVPYLLRCENRMVAAFWLGDSMTAVFCAAAAIAWRRAGWGLTSYMIFTGPPVIIASAVAFMYIHKHGLARLPPETQRHAFELVARDEEGESDADLGAPAMKLSAYAWMPLTMKMAAVVFWSQFADWGFGDSIYPYACSNSSSHQGRVRWCELWCSEVSLAAQLAGTSLAAGIDLRIAAYLGVPTSAYTVLFGLLAYAAFFHRGAFAHGPGLVVLVVGALRFVGPYMRNVVPRHIQPNYPTKLHDSVAVFLGVVSIAGNLLGSAAVTVLIRGGILSRR